MNVMLSTARTIYTNNEHGYCFLTGGHPSVIPSLVPDRSWAPVMDIILDARGARTMAGDPRDPINSVRLGIPVAGESEGI